MPVFCDVTLSLDVSRQIIASIFKGWEFKEGVPWKPQPLKWRRYISSKVENTDAAAQLLIREETDLQWNRCGNLKSHRVHFVYNCVLCVDFFLRSKEWDKGYTIDVPICVTMLAMSHGAEYPLF
jgi:hypothetical protein